MRICCSPSRRRNHPHARAVRSIVKRVASIAEMRLPVWIALVLVLLSLTAGATFVFLRALRLWHAFKSFGSALDGSVRGLTGSLEGLSRNAESLGSSAGLQASVARLRASLARAAVLRAAVEEARGSFGRLTAVYPRK